jgi:hypothetical protein
VIWRSLPHLRDIFFGEEPEGFWKATQPQELKKEERDMPALQTI